YIDLFHLDRRNLLPFRRRYSRCGGVGLVQMDIAFPDIETMQAVSWQCPDRRSHDRGYADCYLLVPNIVKNATDSQEERVFSGGFTSRAAGNRRKPGFHRGNNLG